ncbi:MAG: PIN domain nuclease, partial [Desulfobacterales bacterium]
DFIIVQNAKQNGCSMYSLDRHFSLMEPVIGFELFGN